MKIQVTKLDIKRGLQNNASLCAVSRAIQRATRYKRVVHSGLGSITVGQTVYPTPLAVRKFINAYDSGTWVKPLEFELGDAILQDI